MWTLGSNNKSTMHESEFELNKQPFHSKWNIFQNNTCGSNVPIIKGCGQVHRWISHIEPTIEPSKVVARRCLEVELRSWWLLGVVMCVFAVWLQLWPKMFGVWCWIWIVMWWPKMFGVARCLEEELWVMWTLIVVVVGRSCEGLQCNYSVMLLLGSSRTSVILVVVVVGKL